MTVLTAILRGSPPSLASVSADADVAPERRRVDLVFCGCTWPEPDLLREDMAVAGGKAGADSSLENRLWCPDQLTRKAPYVAISHRVKRSRAIPEAESDSG